MNSIYRVLGENRHKIRGLLIVSMDKERYNKEYEGRMSKSDRVR